MSWTRGTVHVRTIGGALLLEVDDERILVDAPTGCTAGPVRGVLCTTGRLSRLAGLLGVLSDQPTEVWVPLADDRGALLAELAQQAWSKPVVVDAVTPGSTLDIGRGTLTLRALTGREGEVVLGARFVHPDATLALLPRCVLDRRAHHLCRGADLIASEPDSFAWDALAELAEEADLLVGPVGFA